MLSGLFVPEMTAVQGQCASCGAIAAFGGQPLYMSPLSPGGVLRCANCEDVLLVVSHGGGRYRLGLPGLKWLEVLDTERPL
jgi:hypothetical protein